MQSKATAIHRTPIFATDENCKIKSQHVFMKINSDFSFRTVNTTIQKSEFTQYIITIVIEVH